LKQKFLFVLDYITLSFFNSPARLDFSAGTKSSAWTKSWRSAAPLRGWMDQSRITFFIKKDPAPRCGGLCPGGSTLIHPRSGAADRQDFVQAEDFVPAEKSRRAGELKKERVI
jgi:hypothetical protein